MVIPFLPFFTSQLPSMLVPSFQILLLVVLLFQHLGNITKVSLFLCLSVLHAYTYFFLTTMKIPCSFSNPKCFWVVVWILFFSLSSYYHFGVFCPSSSPQLLFNTVCKAGRLFLTSQSHCFSCTACLGLSAPSLGV